MPSILNDDDKDTVKRFVPKQTNKIQAVAVAKLFVAYPDRSRWTYTGLQGAVVLANDLVGNTYWLKMVDISPSARGVIWDQEIFDTWHYNQDRTFFHTFELEECLAGLSFVDEKEAKQFKKKMDDREKNASRATKSNPFGGSQPVHKSSRLGSFFGHRHSSAPTPPESPRTNLPPPHVSHNASLSSMSLNGSQHSEFALLDAFDPLWREHFGQDLRDKGLTDDFIKENQEFIVDFLREEQQNANSAPAATHALPPPPPPVSNGHDSGRSRPPPPPPPGGRGAEDGGGRTTAPPPPAPRKTTKAENESAPSPPPEPPAPAGPKSAMLGDIQKAGGIAALKKVDRSQIRDRSAAQVGDSGSSGGPPAGAAPAAGGGGGMADALAAALQKRKEKVSRSDDESDHDEW
ncbi:hypothetical protein NLU13_4186 [Sarocladium strictum]|uniref:Uncharacterized protein n=1 Tax=Sarocladium strictum TaxID=5046 RepID=A0AA39GJ14_SARSR|nr:hypothetical protein NLU13_4186 [Sarocladium strictum]